MNCTSLENTLGKFTNKQSGKVWKIAGYRFLEVLFAPPHCCDPWAKICKLNIWIEFVILNGKNAGKVKMLCVYVCVCVCGFIFFFSP